MTTHALHPIPRPLHPAAWWGWATALAVGASRTTNPILLALIVSITAFVVASRRPATPWSGSYIVFLRLGLASVAIRVVLFTLLGSVPGEHVLFTLPQVPLPDWMAGVRLGGTVTLEGTLAAVYDGLRLAVILVCVGAANTLTSPRRLLKSLPSALQEAGVAVTVALAFAPQAVASAGRLRNARKLRGRPDRGLRSLRGLAVPVLEGALDRSVDLAAAMDARGFGRRGTTPAAVRRTIAALMLTGLVTMLASTYALIDSGAPGLLGLPLLIAGGVMTAAGFVIGARRGGRTRYRPDPWTAPEWLVVVSGVVAAVAVALAPVADVYPSTSPPVTPSVPLLAIVGLLVAALPAWLSPPLPEARTAVRRAPAKAERELRESRAMIRFDGVTVTYPEAASPVLADADLQIDEGEMCLVIGRTGSGKSTLLRCINGLVPHFSGGRLTGRVTVAGRDTRECRPRDLADVVGFVGQDPLSGFVTDSVEDELAYGMESLGISPTVMRKRVEETLDLLGLADIRDRPLLSLSAGQQQRVAIGSVLTVHPNVLVLDEPTSALDPAAAEDVLAALTRLVHDLSLTVVLAEHRLERVVQYADRIVFVPGHGRPIESGPPAELLAHSPVVPPVVELGRLLGWSPLPLSVRDARRAAGPLREQLAALRPTPRATPARREPVARLRGIVSSYGDVLALRGVDLDLYRGEIVALMGRNGAGKSTLLSVLAGLRPPRAGVVSIDGADMRGRQRLGLVPHEPTDLLWAQSVMAECADADRGTGVPPGTTHALLTSLTSDVDDDLHPRDLSEGQRLALALAVVLVADPAVIALDEPTRGLDYPAKQQLVSNLRRLADEGHGVVLATHDVELVAELADRIVVLADGEVVADGPATEVVVASPIFAPQVSKVLAPLPWLTVRSVEEALAG